MNKKLLSITISTLLLVVVTMIGAPALAEGSTPAALLGTGFTYQGRLQDTGGNPITSTCNFRFSLWDAVSGVNQIGANSNVNGVAVAGGYFTIQVNSANEFGNSAFSGNNARWLQVEVQCSGDPGYTTLTPRQPLTPTPYAFYAMAAGSAPWSGLSGIPAGFADGVDNDTTYTSGTGVSLSGGAFSLSASFRLPQTCSSGQSAEWSGSAWGCATYAPNGHNHWGASWNGLGTGLTLLGGSNGLSATASDTGVYGYATGSVGGTNGVYGKSDSTGGHGLTGLASASSGATYGVYGSSYSNSGYGVYGYAASASGLTYGVYGQSDSTGGYGVYGEALVRGVVGKATSTTGSSIGVLGQSFAPDGIGVFGDSMDYGVFGKSSSTGGYGGFFQNWAGGVALLALSSSPVGGDIFQVSNNGSIVFRVNGNGDAHADGGYHCGNNIDDGAGDLNEDEIAPCVYDQSPADFAEMLPAAGAFEPGDVMVVGLDGQLTISTQAYQSSVVGVYSTRPSYLGNGDKWGQDGYAPLAIVGVVPVKVSAENGPILPGDLLTTSTIPGYAMKASPVTLNGITFYPSGVLIGKALEQLEAGKGLILVLVTLQ